MKYVFNLVFLGLFCFMFTTSKAQHTLKIEAYVVYEDGSESQKNLLSDNPMEIDNASLYNIDVGQTNPDDIEGLSARELKIIISGTEDKVDVNIKKGKKNAINKKGVTIVDKLVINVENIECVPVRISVMKGKKEIGKKLIDFTCGE